jgi:hypothetical protein
MTEVEKVGEPGFYLAWKPGHLLTLMGDHFYHFTCFLHTLGTHKDDLSGYRLFYFTSMSEYGLAIHCFSKNNCVFLDPQDDEVVQKNMNVINTILSLRSP